MILFGCSSLGVLVAEETVIGTLPGDRLGWQVLLRNEEPSKVM
jgi:hypothetical protein